MSQEHEKSADNALNALRVNLESHGLELTEDSFIRWNKRNPAHPRNWTAGTKAYNTGVILFLELTT